MNNWKKDIGYDEISDNWFGVYIMNEQGKVVCQVFGETIEECDENADRIIETTYIV